MDILYGIWKDGWIRVNGEPVAFKEKAVAQIYARWLCGKVYPIDDSLEALEGKLKEAEKEKVWHTLKTLPKRLQKKNGS